MQQFTVPQFIDVEDKVIGPITVRQFIIMLVAGVIIAILYKLLYFTPFLIMAIIVMGITGILAFAKVNGIHFHMFFINFLISLFKPDIRVWNNAFGKDALRIETEKVTPQQEEKIPEKNYNSSRLSELSLIVDTQGVFRGNKHVNSSANSFTKTVHTREYDQ